jgi:hypothetical protein
MKSTSKAAVKNRAEDDLLPHYDFDYSKSKPNRFAKRKKERVLILLDTELSKVFRNQEEVENALRSLIHAIPPKSLNVSRS